MESTPDGMEKLEWVDEFEDENSAEDTNAGGGEVGGGGGTNEASQLYHYYAKTFENTGEFLEHCCPNCSQQDPHMFDSDMASPLHYASALGHVECVIVLLKHDAPINVVNSEGYTPLHVGAGSVEVTRLLIEHGALVNAKTLSDGKTPLHLAIEHYSNESAQLLLQMNANINETDDDGETPLMAAIMCNMTELAVELIERGARINLQDKHGFTAFYYAATGGYQHLAKLLLERGARRLPSHHLLHRCLGPSESHRAMVELLLEQGENLSIRDGDNCTPIMLAVILRLPEMLAYLLDQAEEQHRQGLHTDPLDKGLLMYAVYHIDNAKDFQSILRVLVAHGPSTRRDLYSYNLPTPIGYHYNLTPLSRAIYLHRLDIAQVLLREGCDISQLKAANVVRELLMTCSHQALSFAEMLRHAGIRFPLPGEGKPTEFKHLYDLEMRQLSTQPLTLQSLSRQVIRQKLLKTLKQNPNLHDQYPPTAESSTLARIVDEQLNIPTVLKKYVSEFGEVPTVEGIVCKTRYASSTPENWR